MKKAHQRIIREKKDTDDIISLFQVDWEKIDKSLNKAIVRRINFKTAESVILKYEWIGTMPLPKSCRYMYGIYFDNYLGGAIVYVEPSTRQFKDFPRQAVQLNRGACIWWTPLNTASKLIAESLKDLKKEGIKIIVAYCTPEAGEIGTIYQALGWWYVGKTKGSYSYFLDNHWISERTLADKIAWAKNRDSRWLKAFKNLPKRKMLPKLKYVKLLGSHKENKNIIKYFNFKSLPYSKRNAE